MAVRACRLSYNRGHRHEVLYSVVLVREDMVLDQVPAHSRHEDGNNLELLRAILIEESYWDTHSPVVIRGNGISKRNVDSIIILVVNIFLSSSYLFVFAMLEVLLPLSLTVVVYGDDRDQCW